MSGTDAKLNMSLDDLIKQQRKQPQAQKGKAKPGQKGKPGVTINKLKGKQAAGKKATAPRAPLKVQKGGVQKTAAPGKGQQRGQKQGGRPDVRVVPRPNGRFSGMAPPMGGFHMPPHFAMPMNFPMAMAGGMRQQQAPRAAPPAARWQNDRFQENQRKLQMMTTKLFISNLDYAVTDEDIKELFGTIGELKESCIHYDKSGRSMGTAHVIYTRTTDAKAAFDKYNGVALDNKKMNIEMVEAPLPPGTIKKLSSGIAVRKPGATGPAAGVRGRGNPQGGDFMEE